MARSHTAVIRSDTKSPAKLLAKLRSLASRSYVCSDVVDWRGTGATFQIQSSDGRKVDIILAQLFQSELGDYFVTAAVHRNWKSWFSTIDPSLLDDVVLRVNEWLASLNVTEVLWSEEAIPDFSTRASWGGKPPIVPQQKHDQNKAADGEGSV